MAQPSKDFIFQQMARDTFERECFGFEAAACCLSDIVDGMTQCVVTASVNFGVHASRADLETKITEALILFRFLVPGIACKIIKSSPPGTGYRFSYKVPDSFEAVQTWAKEVVVFSEETRSMDENHALLRDNRYWKVSENRYCVEMHVSQVRNDWIFSILALHASIDGRGSFMFMDLFLQNLQSVIGGTSQPTSSIKWGEEVSRLPLPGPFVQAVAETGSPPQLPDPSMLMAAPEPNAKGGEIEATPSPWRIAPVNARSCSEDVSRRLKLSKETTAKLHSASKAHGRTISQVASALLTLAFCEQMLKDAAEAGGDRFTEISEDFERATHYLVASFLVDQRARFPRGFNSFKSGNATPHFCADSVQLYLPMNSVHKIVDVNKSSKKVSCKFDLDAFWNGLVADVSDAWKKQDVSNPAYLKRQFGMHLFTRAEPFNTSMFSMVTQYISSIGDLGRLGVLESFRPTESSKSITVNDLAFSYRSVMPLHTTMLYQFDDQLHFHVYTGGQWEHANSLKYFLDTLESRIADFCS